jgi:hypothetical protein
MSLRPRSRASRLSAISAVARTVRPLRSPISHRAVVRHKSMRPPGRFTPGELDREKMRRLIRDNAPAPQLPAPLVNVLPVMSCRRPTSGTVAPFPPTKDLKLLLDRPASATFDADKNLLPHRSPP